MVKDWLAYNQNPRTLLYLGMQDTMTLADGTVEPAVDIMNNKQVGVDAIIPKARPLIPASILTLVTERREQRMKGQWDPFFEHAFGSNGIGLAFQDSHILPTRTEARQAKQMPS